MKLSERLRELSAAQEPCDPHTHDFGKKTAFEEAALLAEDYEAEQEELIQKLRDKIAECEDANTTLVIRGSKLLDESDALKKHVAELETTVRDKQRRVVELEAQSDRTDAEICKLDARIADLQSQLAWTPVSAGLPTEPGWYEFSPSGDGGCRTTLLAFEFTGEHWICHQGIDDVRGEPSTDSWSPYVLRGLGGSYRRIELPRAPPPFAKETSPDSVRELHVAQGCVVPPTTTLTDEAQDADLPSVTVSITPRNTLNVDLNALEWCSLEESGVFLREIVRNLDHLMRQPVRPDDYIAWVPTSVTTAMQLHVKAVSVMNAELNKGRLFKEGGKWRFFQ